MKTRLLWTLILAVGSTALYFGIARPEVASVPKRTRDYLAKDPATHPPVQLPPLVVSESRLPALPLNPTDVSPDSPDVPTQGQPATDLAPGAPVPGKNAAAKETVEGGREARIETRK